MSEEEAPQLPAKLRAALDNAPEDSFGQRWAGARIESRSFVVVLRANGTLLVECKWKEDGYRKSVRLSHVPANLHWKPLQPQA